MLACRVYAGPAADGADGARGALVLAKLFDDDWRRCHCALTVVAQMRDHLKSVSDEARCIDEANPRIRFAGINELPTRAENPDGDFASSGANQLSPHSVSGVDRWTAALSAHMVSLKELDDVTSQQKQAVGQARGRAVHLARQQSLFMNACFVPVFALSDFI